ncbi:MAG: hypothetical protein Q6361_03780, partial [Candidatus Hermodarchaeota archaeon]|nr:hypothetical protein [Candidatus Hermodarchaeota archaeon]
IDVTIVKRVKPPIDETKQVKDALQWALRLAANDKEWIQAPRYQAGLAGFDEWIATLEKGAAVQFGNAYNAMVWWECRDMAHHFFLEARERLSSKVKTFFEKASQLYGQVSEHLLAFTKLFPFEKDTLTMDPIPVNDTIKEGVLHLKKAREAEAQGLKVIETIIDKL